MKGIDLARSFWFDCCRDDFFRSFPELRGSFVAGMCGPGSENFFLDDELSQDHDWGPGFCLWVSDSDYENLGMRLEDWYRGLKKEYLGFEGRHELRGEEHRVGPMSIADYYCRYTGLKHYPQTISDWRGIPESNLAICSNGQIFEQEGQAGEVFCTWREKILGYFPEALRLRKIRRLCISVSQTGQYNFARALKRGDVFTARYCLVKFSADVMSLLFTLEKIYEPYFKLLYRYSSRLSERSAEAARKAAAIASSEGLLTEALLIDIEDVCYMCAGELREKGIVDFIDPYLLGYVDFLDSKIKELKTDE